MCRIGDTGRLGQFTWNFEFLKNVSIFHNRKTKLKQNGCMEQRCLKVNLEELSHYKIRFLWIAINLH